MGVVVVTWLFLNFAVCRDAARRAGLSATAKLLVIDCVHVYGLLLGLYGDYASVLLFFLSTAYDCIVFVLPNWRNKEW